MNRLNPLYILALIVTFFVVSISMTNSKKDEFESANKNMNSLSIKAKDFKEYKNTWFNKDEVIKKVNLVINNSSFKKEKVLKVINQNSIKIKIQSDNPIVLNKFLNRVLNQKFIIKKLDIQKRLISLEIGFK